jgi:sterol desaturase/sphingolipid hydroxylase (fatty acid hydroxylase superfamily)
MINVLCSIIGYDIWFYISHVLLHRRSLYKYHSEHHAKRAPMFLDTYTGHTMEGPIQSLGAIVPFLFLSYSVYDIAAIILLLNIRGMMRHDARCIPLIGNHHLLHHEHPAYNFGEYWIDSLCGTRYPDDSVYKRGYLYL